MQSCDSASGRCPESSSEKHALARRLVSGSAQVRDVTTSHSTWGSDVMSIT